LRVINGVCSMDEGTRLAGEDTTQINLATTLPVTLDSSVPAENAPALSTTLDTTQPPSGTSPKSVTFDLTQTAMTVPFPSTLLDSEGQVRTAPVPSVVLETKYDWKPDPKTRSFLIPLRELLSWRALKDVLASIREVDGGNTPIIYYRGTVVIGKYWCDIIHDGASFLVVYTSKHAFRGEAGVPPSKYWSTE
jgi:hypothetical protein